MIDVLADNIKDAIEVYIEGSRILHNGYFLNDKKMQVKGFKLLKKGMTIIDDESPNGREILLPLLDDSNPDISVAVAAALLQSHTEAAKVRLKHIYETCVSDHWFSSMNLLFFKGEPSICPPDPRFPKLNLTCGMEWLKEPTTISM